MKTEYVTPPYSEAMISVCNSLEKKIDAIIDVQVENGLDVELAKQNAMNYITKDIKLPE